MTLAQGCLITHYTQGGGLWSGCMMSPCFMLTISVFCIGYTLVRVPNHMWRAKGHCKWWWTSFHYGWLQEKNRWVPTKKLQGTHKHCSSNGSARVMFKAGKNWDGYFTNNKILAQANWAMDILNNNYPDDEHAFFYDNAKTHTACQPDALSTQYMTVKPPRMRPPTSCAQSKTLMALYKKFGCKTVSLLIIHCNHSIFQIATHRLAYLKACTWLSRSALSVDRVCQIQWNCSGNVQNLSAHLAKQTAVAIGFCSTDWIL